MTETEDFLAATLPRLTEAETALHNGDPGPRLAMWSRTDPLTVLGAAVSAHGRAEIESLFRDLGARFSGCESYRNEIIAAGASGDLAYTVALEYVTVRVDGSPPRSIGLRATTAFRREDGEWKVVHRHADPLPSGDGSHVVQQLRDPPR
jgi:ketosteroid isomerase-like protein